MRKIDVLREDALDDRVELAGAVEVVPEGLLDDDAAPGRRRAGQPGALELFADGREGAGRDREVEGVVAARAALGVEVADGRGEPVERVRVVEAAAGRSAGPRRGCATPPRDRGSWPAALRRGRTAAKSWSAQSRRAKPTSEKPGGSSPRLARS